MHDYLGATNVPHSIKKNTITRHAMLSWPRPHHSFQLHQQLKNSTQEKACPRTSIASCIDPKSPVGDSRAKYSPPRAVPEVPPLDGPMSGTTTTDDTKSDERPKMSLAGRGQDCGGEE